MRNPSPELVARVRANARRFGAARGIAPCHVEDLECDALEWLCRYTPPDGWDVTGATLHALKWALLDIARKQARAIRRRPYPIGLPGQYDPDDPYGGDLDRVMFRHATASDETARVDLALLVDTLPPLERDSIIAPRGDGRLVAKKHRVTESAVSYARQRGAARLRSALRSP